VRVPRRGLVALAVGIALLTLTWIPASAGNVPAWEASLFHRVNDLPNGLWWLLRIPMQLGSLVGSFAVVVAVGLSTRDRRLALAALVGSQAAYWSAKAVKEIVARGRPAALLPGVHVRETAGGFGYVSAHTAVAFALAAAIAPSFPRAGQAVVILLAVLVACARVYAGAHLPLDVIGGAGLGLMCGTLARVVCRVARTSP
jgi:glycosyltransferase 2 family protein